ncbi:MAG: hypothetical protein U9R75_03835 [Candidatus Thermoplasmatota archaeon]|nr:hypothetical protein [Candidatus Thermoplasmatota archaeon]
MTPEEEREILVMKKSQEIDEKASEIIWAKAQKDFNQEMERVVGKNVFVLGDGKRFSQSEKVKKERISAAVA